MGPTSHTPSAFTVSPIGTLPVELLSEIFFICTLSTDTHPQPGRGDYSPPTITSESVLVPHLLSSVNRRWRAIALSQPCLWSNICITPELLDWQSNGRWDAPPVSQLNTSHITTYISRSKNYSLNILIDGRDPDWDFSEPDVGIDFGTTSFNTLFSSEHMQVALSLLLPHITRWKHLTILTDTWAPMYTALKIINPSLTQSGAPLLQSMSLMRCNDYVSYSRRFQPRQLSDLGFLTSPTTTTSSRADLLPSLKHLTLRGVHVDWDALGNILDASGNGLSHLELASHPRDVRPSISQFHNLLQSTPNLQTLYVVGTGPEGPGSENDSVHNYEPVHLPKLRSVALGYRSETGGRSLLHFLDAPLVQSLVLDDTTYPADQSDVNAGPILSYLGTKQCDGNEHSLESTVVGQPSIGFEKGTRKRSICAAQGDTDNLQQCTAGAFPLLTRVVLRNVKSTFQPLTTFFNSLRNVTHLELSGMSMLSIHALVPYSLPPSHDVPCPRLHSLTFKDSDYSIEDLDFIITRLSSCRQARGAPELHDLNFHVKLSRAGDVQLINAAAASSPDSNVRIFSDKDAGIGADDDDDDDDDDGNDLVIADDGSDGDEDAAFRPGGAFNDPIFDAYYAHTSTHPLPSSH